MSFGSFHEFLIMGGHGLYVWSAYVITLIVLGYNIIRPIMMRNNIVRRQKQLLKQEEQN
jgi:heme exporter protein D